MKILQKITNKRLRYRIRNEEIRMSCGIEEIHQWNKNRRIEWNQYIEKIIENRIVRTERPITKWEKGNRTPKKKVADNFNAG